MRKFAARNTKWFGNDWYWGDRMGPLETIRRKRYRRKAERQAAKAEIDWVLEEQFRSDMEEIAEANEMLGWNEE